MSHLVSYKWIRKTQVIPELAGFYKNVGFTWRVSDCEELVEAITEDVRVGLTEWQVYWWRWRESNPRL